MNHLSIIPANYDCSTKANQNELVYQNNSAAMDIIQKMTNTHMQSEASRIGDKLPEPTNVIGDVPKPYNYNYNLYSVFNKMNGGSKLKSNIINNICNIIYNK